MHYTLYLLCSNDLNDILVTFALLTALGTATEPASELDDSSSSVSHLCLLCGCKDVFVCRIIGTKRL